MSNKTHAQKLEQLMEEVHDLSIKLREKQMIARGLEDQAGAANDTDVARKALEVHSALGQAFNIVDSIK
ncbi:hypothetical protein [Bdellovibrio sp. NC01]|uniref:hypothetical protein n=1 Tax=Bdellovibrio sp. NC01 TaxID=2220073 RepID=UPI00115C2CF7|nr:hypothetical protein [Bdellovibrio sp. NC01]QDK37202.1 hypothetical protein DOE51_06165 [Bdellovibrio sp. NC01]